MNAPTRPLQWIDSGGGPLLLLSSEYLGAWSGSDGQDAADVDAVQHAAPTDYDRACDVQDYLGLVSVDGGQGLVLGDEPLSTAWWQVSPTEGLLVRWVYGEDQATVIRYLAQFEEGIWEPSGITCEVGTHPLHLFDAAWPGADMSEHLVVTLDAGRYEVDTAIARPDSNTELLLHRFRRQ